MEKLNRCFHSFKGLVIILLKKIKASLWSEWSEDLCCLYYTTKVSVSCLSVWVNADAQFVLITPTTLCRAEMRVVLLPPKDASGSDQECQIDFVFNYICAFPLCCGKFYQQACALSDQPTAMAQHACRICSPCTCHCAQSDAVPTSVYSSASFLAAYAVDLHRCRDVIGLVRFAR